MFIRQETFIPRLVFMGLAYFACYWLVLSLRGSFVLSDVLLLMATFVCGFAALRPEPKPEP